MIPHERSLVKKYENRPFALLGVNSDGTNTEAGRAKYRKLATEMGVNWRSFRNSGTNPPISKSWRVLGWPTLYYIDHEGVIRRKWIGSPGNEIIDAVLDKLIHEAELARAPESVE